MGKYNFAVILLWGSLLLGCKDITTSSTMNDGATNLTHVAVEQSAGNGISKELMDDLRYQKSRHIPFRGNFENVKKLA